MVWNKEVFSDIGVRKENLEQISFMDKLASDNVIIEDQMHTFSSMKNE